MLDDHLYERLGVRSDAVFAQHLSPIPSGSISIRPSPVLISADTVRVRLFSSQGRAANPRVSVDVVVLASKIILALQVLAREVGKDGCASISTEEIHAGEPGADWVSHADIVLDVKAYDAAIRSRLIDGIRETVSEKHSNQGPAKHPRSRHRYGHP